MCQFGQGGLVHNRERDLPAAKSRTVRPETECTHNPGLHQTDCLGEEMRMVVEFLLLLVGEIAFEHPRHRPGLL